MGIVLIGISGCGCDDPTDPSCDNYDPCFFEKQKPNLDFDIYQTFLGRNQPFFLGDTILTGYPAYFEANTEDGISYEWWYGIDTVTTEENNIQINFSLSDSTLLINNPVPITLVVEYEPNRECYPNHTGRDTITKYIYFRMRRDAAYMGKWEVYVDGDTDNPYEIEFLYRTPDSWTTGYNPHLHISNLYNEGGECFQVASSINDKGYSEFDNVQFSLVEGGCGLRGYPYSTKLMTGKVDTENDILYLNWEEWYRLDSNDPLTKTPHSLIGYKID